MWHTPSHGTRSAGRRTFLALRPCRGRCHIHTCPSRCRSSHQVSCSGAGMSPWTADIRHPPGWGGGWGRERERGKDSCYTALETLEVEFKHAASCVCFKCAILNLTKNTLFVQMCLYAISVAGAALKVDELPSVRHAMINLIVSFC